MTSSRRTLRASAFGLPTLLFVLGLSGAAQAQRTAQDIASARQLYNEGIELREKGDMKGALEKFKAAHALGNTPLTGIELCRTYSALKQPVEAREVCLGVGRIAPLPEESQRSRDARSDAARLAEAEKPRIGAIRLKITGVPAGWEPTVTVDGAQVPALALNEPRAVNPGAHVVVAKVGSGPETRATLETQEGETRDLEIGVQPPPAGDKPGPVMASGAQTPPPPAKRNTFATTAFAIAGVSGAVGAIAGLVAMSGESDLDKQCASKICGREQWDTLDSARTWGGVSTAFFIVGGVALGAGLVSTLTSGSSTKSGALTPRSAKASSSRSTVRATPVFGVGGAGLHGSF
jgi:hypothetical protein